MQKYAFSLSLSVLALAILACAQFTVHNRDETHAAIVHVTLPGGDGGSVSVEPGEEVTWTASEAGQYTVKVLPSEAYLSQMRRTREDYSRILANPTEYAPSFALSYVKELQDRINALAAGTACKGEIARLSEDAEEIPTIVVTISYDVENQVWTCG